MKLLESSDCKITLDQQWQPIKWFDSCENLWPPRCQHWCSNIAMYRDDKTDTNVCSRHYSGGGHELTYADAVEWTTMRASLYGLQKRLLEMREHAERMEAYRLDLAECQARREAEELEIYERLKKQFELDDKADCGLTRLELAVLHHVLENSRNHTGNDPLSWIEQDLYAAIDRLSCKHGLINECQVDGLGRCYSLTESGEKALAATGSRSEPPTLNWPPHPKFFPPVNACSCGP